MKIKQVGAELFHADGQTDMKKLAVAFCIFANSPRKGTMYAIWDERNCRLLGIGLWGLDGTSDRAAFTSFQLPCPQL